MHSQLVPLPTPHDALKWRRFFILSGWFVTIAILIDCIIGHLLIGLGSSQSFVFEQVARLVNGATPYIANADPSPPLIHLLYLVPWLLSQCTGLSTATALYLCTYALLALSLLFCHHLLRTTHFTRHTRCLILAVIALTSLLLSFKHLAFATPSHLMLTFTTPWLLLCSPLIRFAAAPPRLRAGAALFAAFGFALSPAFLLLYLITILIRRNYRAQARMAEHHIILGFFAGYAITIAVFFPNYYSQILPLAWQTYTVSLMPFSVHLSQGLRLLYHFWPLGLGIAASFTFPRPSRNPLGEYLALLLAASFAAYMIGAGEGHAIYPFHALAFTLGSAACCHMLMQCRPPYRGEKLPTFAITLLLAGCIAVLLAYPPVHRAFTDVAAQQRTNHPQDYQLPNDASLYQINRNTSPRSHYLWLSTQTSSLAIKAAERESMGRYDRLWPLPGIVANRKDGKSIEYRNLYQRFVKTITADIIATRPDRIIIDTSPFQRPLPPNFNLTDYLMNDPEFASSMRLYKLAQHINNCTPYQQENCAYDIFYRDI